MSRGFLLLALLGFLAAACGSDGQSEAERAEIVTWLVEHDEPPTTAECLAGELSSFELADFEALAEVSDGKNFDVEFSEAVAMAREACAG